MIGQTVGQYKILEKLGEGGMGTVYKAIDVMIERQVAIKMLRAEIARQPELVERFRAEAITLAKLNTPGIATLYNFFRAGEDYFMVMEFVSGRTLESLLRQYGAMPWREAVAIFCKALDGIEPAHRMGIMHRDIKPANIMLTESGDVKIMDFGIARVLGAARMTREGRMVGTLEYVSPERVRGKETDVRSDIYSLGVVLYEMLSGRLPFESDSEYELMKGHLEVAPPPMASLGRQVPPIIESLMMRALAKAPEARYQSCAEFAAAMRACLQQPMPEYPPAVEPHQAKATRFEAAAVPVATPQYAPPSATPPKKTWAYIVVGSAAALLVIVVVVAVFMLMRPKPASSATNPQTPAPAITQPAVATPTAQPAAGSADEILKNAVPLPDSGVSAEPAARTAAKKHEPTPEEEQARKRAAALKALDQ
ncbi:MAG TPA: protein kinase [Bryobacteraceae bacterium]|nr:protein kinase [Bryobacteraceae bacterium]